MRVERHWEYALPEPVDCGDLMAHFYIYADESGKAEQSDYISFCGYVGHALEFERTMVEWDTCRFAWGVPHIHMRCVMNPERDKTGEWQELRNKWAADWERRRDAMLEELATIILNSHLAAVGCVVDAKYFRNMPPSKFKESLDGDPLYLAAYMLLMNSIDKIDVVNKTYPISIILDNDEERAKGYYDLLSSLKANFQRVRERITAITFGSDAAYPALQMADMIAYEARALMVDKLLNKRDAPSSTYFALTRRLVHQPVLYTPEFLDRVAVDKA